MPRLRGEGGLVHTLRQACYEPRMIPTTDGGAILALALNCA